MAAVRSVVVVGAGIGGLSCALACAQAGLRVEVVESRASLASMAAHVDVVPNLLRDLVRLGVASECVKAGFAYHGIAVVDAQGRQHFELPTPRIAGDRYPAAIGIAFDRFMAVLRSAVVAAGAVIRANAAVVSVDVRAGSVSLGRGETVSGDLVLLTAGADSALVEQVFGAPTARDVAQTWWHALIRRPHRLDRTTWLIGEQGRRLLLVPVSAGEAGIAILGRSRDGLPSGGGAMSTELAGWGGLALRIAELVSEDTPTTVRTSTSGLLAPPWSRGTVLAAGGACHSIASPFGQSAAQAVEDAAVLADLLVATRDRDELLARYMERRFLRVSRVHALTRQAAHWIERPEPSTDLMALADELAAVVAIAA